MNTWNKLPVAAASIALVGALSACDETVTPEVDEALVADVALIAADATLEDFTLLASPFSFSAPAAVDGVDGTYAHPGGHEGFDVEGTRSVTFLDVEGAEQDGYDPLTTASIHFVHVIEGEVVRDGWSASLHRERDVTVSGLEGEETTRVWNGTGSSEISRSRHTDDGTERSYTATGSALFEDIVIPVPGSDSRWPLSGTITRTLDVVRTGPDGEVTRSFEVVVTFDGTSTATAVVNGVEMEIDLSTVDGRNPVRWLRRSR